MADTRYTEKLIMKGQERKRLTAQLAALVAEVANSIAATCEVGTKAYVEGLGWLKIIERRSNIGSDTWLAVGTRDDFTGEYMWKVFENREPGSSYYLHGDFSSIITVAERDDFLAFANHIPEVVKAFADVEDQAIQALRQAFVKLRAVAEQ